MMVLNLFFNFVFKVQKGEIQNFAFHGMIFSSPPRFCPDIQEEKIFLEKTVIFKKR
jgi:hypothetical protein